MTQTESLSIFRSTPSRDDGQRRTAVALLALAVLTVAVVAVAARVAFSFVPTTSPWGADDVAVATPAPVPDGWVTATSVEHVVWRTSPVPPGWHAVQVRLSLRTDAKAPSVTLSTVALMMEGQGIDRPIPPSSADPQSLTATTGKAMTATLVYLVPDQSTRIGIVLPGGVVLSAQHANHPGDSAAGNAP